MKKKFFIIIFSFLFLYVLYPFFGIYKFYVATKKSDVNYIAKNVNWESLRLGFKNDLKIILDKRIKNKNILGNKLFQKFFETSVIDYILEEFITAEKIVLLLNNPKEYNNLLKDEIKNPVKKKEKKSEIKKINKFKFHGPNISMLREKINYAFFINLNTFRIDFNQDGYPIVADLKLINFKWKIYRIYLPIDLIVSKN